jgi:disulfide bond formation protein DsbB
MAPLQPQRALQLRRSLGALIGVGCGYALARHLPLVPSTLLSALVLTAGVSLSAAPQDAGRWWALIGAAAGSLVGTGVALAQAMHQIDPAEQLPQRALTLLLLALAGAIAGRRLQRQRGWQPGRQPRELLRSASGLTTGVFASIVTITYVHSGLDVARTLSSRLSTSLTILVFTLVAPAWLSHLLHHHDQQGDNEH